MDSSRWVFNDVDTLVSNERDAQDEKWGVQNHDFPVWLAVLMEEVGEASQEWLKANFTDDAAARKIHLTNLRTELVQVAAVAHAMVECGIRNNWWPVWEVN